eukprot:4868968-Amphidinium_carterae.1
MKLHADLVKDARGLGTYAPPSNRRQSLKANKGQNKRYTCVPCRKAQGIAVWAEACSHACKRGLTPRLKARHAMVKNS